MHCKIAAQDPAHPTILEETDKAGNALVVRKSRYEKERFRFDSLLTPEMTLYEDFRLVGRQSVKRFIQGYSVGLMTYGQAGVGKTGTLFGGEVTRGHPGLVQQTLEDVFARITQDKSGKWRVTLTAIALYQEKAVDLLVSKRSPRSDVSVNLRSALEIEVQGVSHALSVLNEYLPPRSLSPKVHSKVFTHPSRGSYILLLTLTKLIPGDDQRPGQKSFFFIVDLPGYEKSLRHGVSSDYAAEMKTINHSLSVLTECLQSDRSRQPYRDSLLTLQLRPMFSTPHTEHIQELTILVLVSMKTEDLEDTLATLTWARGFTKVENVPRKTDEGSLRSTLEEKERLITDKDAKLLLLQSENEELKRENANLRGSLAQYQEKHVHLKARLKEMTSSVRKSSSDKEELTRTIKAQAERRYREELEAVVRKKEEEMMQFRMRTSTESSQAFAAQIQRMTTEHDATVAKLMEALMDKQRQEQKLITLVNKEQEECRRLRMELAMRTVKSPNKEDKLDSEISIPALVLPLDTERDSTVLRGETPKDDPISVEDRRKGDDLAVSDLESEEEEYKQGSSTHRRSLSSPTPIPPIRKPGSPSLSQGSEAPLDASRNQIPASPRDEALFTPKSFPSARPSLLPVLTYVLLRMQTKLRVTKLDRSGKEKIREIWVEKLDQFLNGKEEKRLWTQDLALAVVRWNTTSRFKREFNLCFRLCEINDTSADQNSPGFEKNLNTKARSHLSLWARYRQTSYFEVIFDDRQSLVVWSAGLKLGQLAMNSPNPEFEQWRREYELLVEECAMAEG